MHLWVVLFISSIKEEGALQFFLEKSVELEVQVQGRVHEVIVFAAEGFKKCIIF